MPNPTFPLRNEMDRQRMELITDLALSILANWYATWDAYKNFRNGEIRRLALRSKCRGLVFHDRALKKGAEVIYG